MIDEPLALGFYTATGILLLSMLGWYLWRRFVPVESYYSNAGRCLHCGKMKQYQIRVYQRISLVSEAQDTTICKARVRKCKCNDQPG